MKPILKLPEFGWAVCKGLSLDPRTPTRDESRGRPGQHEKKVEAVPLKVRHNCPVVAEAQSSIRDAVRSYGFHVCSR